MVHKQLTFFTLISILFVVFGCDEKPQKKENKYIEIEDIIQKKTVFQLIDDLTKELKIKKVDTIIYYKRTCISCCDFYNIFWIKNGKKYVQKIDRDTVTPISKEIAKSKIFSIVLENYNVFKNTSIKRSEYTSTNGGKHVFIVDHYCYTKIDIRIGKDSIISSRLEDDDFDKYGDSDTLINDHYIENINSKWHFLLTIIENELAIMPETTNREIENFRSKK